MESQSSERGSVGASPGGARASGTRGPLVRLARTLWRACYGARTGRAGDPADALGLPRIGRRMTTRAGWFCPLALTLLFTDCATKRAVEHRLAVGEPQPVVGEVVRFTLSYNRNAAMGLALGGDSRRVVLSALTVAALLVLGVLYHCTRPSERLRLIGVALVAGGALGNLVDRIRSSAGVVDFIDVGFAHVRFWTFNVADMGITAGAVLLLVGDVKRPKTNVEIGRAHV